MNKRIIALALTLLMFCTVHVFALPEEPAGSVTASYSGGRVTFSGSVTGEEKAVAALLFDPTDSQIAMTTCAVTGEGTFSGSISIRLTSSGSYAVKVADYEGGAFFAEDTFNRTVPSSGSSSSQSAPVAEIGSGESFTEANIKKLISEGESLTVGGEGGAMLVFDADALEGISQQADGSIHVNIADVSDKYQQDYPERVVFSLTVNSGDKVITDFGGSVTVSLPYELKEGEAADHVTVWYVTESGFLVAIPCSYDPATKRVNFTVSHFSLYMIGIAPPWENPFVDVGETDWFYSDVQFVHKNGLMVGTSDKAFSPQSDTSRGMIVTILWRLEGMPQAAEPITFTDVQEDEWYYEAVAWAAEKDIVAGYSADKFGPADAITREQMTKILHAYSVFKGYDVKAENDLSAFTDSPSDWAKESVQWAVAKGLLQGKGTGLLAPRANAKRGECAAILQRFILSY